MSEQTLKIGQSVKHATKTLHEAKVVGYSKTGKRVKVKHNYLYPYGVGWAIDSFDPKNLV